MRKILAIFLLTLTLSSCGSIFKSERVFKQPSDKIDRDIFTLDSLGLLLFFVPGAVMLTVDFITGAIYLSPEEAARYQDLSLQKISRDLIIK